LNRHIGANLLRQQVAGYFPKLDAIGSFNWSNNAFLVNPAYFLGGMQVAQALLDFPTRTLRVQQAQIVGDIEKERSLLLALGVLYEVDLRAVQLQQGYESIRAIAAQEAARQEAFNRILGLYREGLENEAATAQELAELSQQAAALDRARTDYQVWWYEFETAALPGESPPPLPRPLPADGKGKVK
jgi:outer membrane protein TolC